MATVQAIPTPESIPVPQQAHDGASQLTADPQQHQQQPQAAAGSVLGDLKEDQTVRSLSQAPELQEPSVVGQQQPSIPRQSYLEPSASERLQDNFVLVATLGLASLIWVMTLVSQAYVSARVSEEYVRTAWFALILQLVLIILMAYLIFTTYLPPYHIQLSTLAALVVVFGVMAIDINIRTPNSASRRAVAASWFFNVFIDLFWVFYFTSPPQALLVHAVHNVRGPTPAGSGKAGIEGGLNATTDQPMQLRPISGVSTMKSAHPSALSPVPGVSIAQATGSRPGTLRKPSSRRTSQRESAVTDAQQRKSGWSFYGKDKPEAVAEPIPSGPSQSQALPEAAPSLVESNQVLPKAEALFSYTAAKEDPAELSFKKGEILYIIDRSGKWWEARKQDGSSGIVPSNYLRVIQ